MKQRRSIRSIITRASVFLLLGAIVNVALAWACVWLIVDLRGYVAHGFTRMERPDWYVTICRRAAAVRLYGFEPQPEQEDEWRAANLAPSILPGQPRWSRFNIPPRGEIERVVDDARGWPMVSLRTTYIAHTDSIDSVVWTSEWIGGIALPPQLPANSLNVWEVRALPLIPIWPNFAINTIIYAGILWLIVAAPGKVRRWRRIKRGLCSRCAYPVGQSQVCTECGRAVKTA